MELNNSPADLMPQGEGGNHRCRTTGPVSVTMPETLGYNTYYPLVGFKRTAKMLLPSRAFYFFTYLANASTRVGPNTAIYGASPQFKRLGVVQFGCSTAGPAYIGFGFRSNLLAATRSEATKPIHIAPNVAGRAYYLLQDLSDWPMQLLYKAELMQPTFLEGTGWNAITE